MMHSYFIPVVYIRYTLASISTFWLISALAVTGGLSDI